MPCHLPKPPSFCFIAASRFLAVSHQAPNVPLPLPNKELLEQAGEAIARHQGEIQRTRPGRASTEEIRLQLRLARSYSNTWLQQCVAFTC